MSKTTYQIRNPGSVSFVIDDGFSFILQKTEQKLNPSVGYGIELDFGVINAIIPFGAELDKSFVKNIENAKNIREVQDICTSWVNV